MYFRQYRNNIDELFLCANEIASQIFFTLIEGIRVTSERAFNDGIEAFVMRGCSENSGEERPMTANV
jgi:hypothetical protein